MADVQEQTARPAGGQIVTSMGAVRLASATDLSGGNDNTYVSVQVDAAGFLRVTGGGTGSNVVQGNSPAGSAPVGNPVLVSGWDTTNVRTLVTDTTGHLVTTSVLLMSGGDGQLASSCNMVGIFLTSSNTAAAQRWYDASATGIFGGGRGLVAAGYPNFTSLSAVAVTGAGSAKGLPYPPQNIGVQVTTTGGPTTATVLLQGSLDNVNWFNIGTSIAGSAGALAFFTASPCTNYRLNLSVLSGGASPTVTGIMCFN